MYSGNDGLFHVIEGAQIVTVQKAIHKQRKLYSRGISIFTAHKGGYVGVRKDGRTADPDLSWDYIEGVQYRPGNGLVSNLERID